MPASYPVLSVGEEKDLLDQYRTQAECGWEYLMEEKVFRGLQDALCAVDGNYSAELPAFQSSTLSKNYTNRARKVLREFSALLTDVRPVGSFDTHNKSAYKMRNVLNRSNRFWWRNRKVDRVLSSTLGWSAMGGSGYLMLTYDAELQDIRPEALDPRDVIPLEPVYSDTIQDWRGVVVRKRIPLSEARRLYPDKAEFLQEEAGNSWFGPEIARNPSGVRKVLSSFWDSVTARKRRFDPPGVEIMRIYAKDYTINETGETVKMGEEGTNWYYEVPPGGRLYPRGKLTICTPDVVLRVLPNPYWHGMFPLVRFRLVEAGHTILGLSLIQDILPLQHSLNESLRGLDDARNKILDPDIIADRRALSKQNLDKLDARRGGGRFHVDTQLTGGDGFRFGTPPDLGNYYLQFLAYLSDSIDDNTGVKGVQAFQQLKQMPAKDTLESFMQAMTPQLRDMARSLEVSVLEVADMMKFNFMQFYGTDKRFEMMGEEGLTDEDQDADPGNMVPAGPGSKEERAQKVARQFKFFTAPNTFLGLSNMNDRMLKFQLWQHGGLSTYSVWQAFDIQGIGEPLGETEPERMMAERRMGLLQGAPPELVQAQLMAALAQAHMAAAQVGMQAGAVNPGGGGAAPAAPAGAASPEGGGVPRGPGRPPEGTEAPTLQTKDGGTRTVVSNT